MILHEEAERGRIVSDLVGPVTGVKAAVDNLVVVTIREERDKIIERKCKLKREGEE